MDKRKQWTTALVLALLATTAAPAQDPRQAPPGFGVPYLIPMSAVPLDQAQREQLASLRRDLHQRYSDLSARLIDLQEQLRAALAEEQRGARAAARLTQEIDALYREARTALGDAREQAQALLTPEQRRVLAKWRAGTRGREGEVEGVPYTVLPSIQADDPDIENLEDPELDPRY